MATFLAAAAAILCAGWALAQTSTVNCVGEEWAFNAQGQSPCVLWAQLSALCQPEGFIVPPLQGSSTAYSPPHDAADLNPCQCSVVAYNLMSACSLCQAGITTSSLFNETQWKASCTSYNSTGVSVASDFLDIPSWAFMPDQGGVFNSTQAQLLAASATSSPASVPAPNPTAISTESPVLSSSNQTSAGAIAGGVIGGLAAITIIVVAAIFLVRKRTFVRSRPAMGSPRGMSQKPADFGMPQDIRISHFVPPQSTNSSVDNLPRAPVSVHPYAANYAVQRNYAAASPPLGKPGYRHDYTSTSPSPGKYEYPVTPVRGYSRTGNVGSQNGPSLYPQSVEGHLPDTTTAYPPAPLQIGSHPYANALSKEDYLITTPDTPSPSVPLMRRQSPLDPTPAKPLPPLRVPQPVRRYPSGTTEFSSTLGSSYGSSTSPLVAAEATSGVLQQPTSIERLLTKGRQVRSSPKTSDAGWTID